MTPRMNPTDAAAADASLKQLGARLLARGQEGLPAADCAKLEGIAERATVSRDAGAEFNERLSFGERVADKVAAFGGSWTFIGIFAAVLVGWVLLNSEVLAHWNRQFDPYPYILLNLFLSMIAAIQAPVIMMSQNRQAARDRLEAKLDYEVNLKAELEIARLHERLDTLRMEELRDLLAQALTRLEAPAHR